MIKVPRFKKELGFTTTPQRSALMGKIRAKDSKPEMVLRKLIWATGLRYRKNVKKLPGKPDIVFAQYKLAVFIDGEFWHGHNWVEKREKIKTNRDFWIPKIERNIQRDLEVTQHLQTMGFKVIRFWEHELRHDAYACLLTVISLLKK